MVGMIVGAAVVGGVWWTKRDSGVLPAPIPISLGTLPTSVLGTQRDDLAARAIGSDTAKVNAQQQQNVLTARIPAYRDAYGGPGIEASYGVIAGKRAYQLLIVNGLQPAPVAGTDSTVAYLRVLSPTDYVQAPGSATTRCVAQPHAAVMIDDRTTVIAARGTVLADPESLVTCVRSDRSRNLSVQLRESVAVAGGPTASASATAMAAEVDRIWSSLAA